MNHFYLGLRRGTDEQTPANASTVKSASISEDHIKTLPASTVIWAKKWLSSVAFFVNNVVFCGQTSI